MSGNTALAVSPKGRALTTGAGIWNGPFLSGPPVKFDLHDTTVTANRLTGDGRKEGAGLYTTVPVTFDHSTVSGNAPNQRSGCQSEALVRR